MVNCPNCAAPHVDAARFCAHCGTSLYAGIDRDEHFAALPDEPVRALAVVSTLMPHVAGRRHYVYRRALTLALLASMIAAGFGILPLALVLAAVALPTVLLTYIHDHGMWRGSPITVIGIGFLLPMALGVGIGMLQNQLGRGFLLTASRGNPLPLNQILQRGLIIPAIVVVAVLVAPLLITSRAGYRHPVDAVVFSALSGSALSLGLSIVVQRGSFTLSDVTAGDAAQIAFIALTLGFLQPVIFATAAATVAARVRRAGARPIIGVLQGMALVVCYELATAVLTPYGSRGIVITAVLAFGLAAIGLLSVRAELHRGLLAEAGAALHGGAPLAHPAAAGQVCAHCGAALDSGDAFCPACGTASAAMYRDTRPIATTAGSPTA